MKRCPTCSATYPDTDRACGKDGARLVQIAVTQGWDAVPEEPAPAPKAVARAAANAGAVTSGWDVPAVPEPTPAPRAAAPAAAKAGAVTSGWDVPEEPAAAQAPPERPAGMPAVKPATPMRSSPVARKTVLGVGVVHVPSSMFARDPEPAPPTVAAAEPVHVPPEPVAAAEPVYVPPEPVALAVAEPIHVHAPSEPVAVPPPVAEPLPSASYEDTRPAGGRNVPVIIAVVVIVVGVAIGLTLLLT